MAGEQITQGLGQDSISDLVQVKLRQNSVLASVFRDVSAFATEGDKSIAFPRKVGEFAVQKLSGAQKGDSQESVFELDKLDLDVEAHIQWIIKKFDQARSKVQLLTESIEGATYSHSLGLDADLYDILEASILTATHQVDSLITQDAIVDAITLANVRRIPRQNRRWLFGNNSYGTLLKIDGFVDASKSNLEIVRTGQIGTLYGLPVFESDMVENSDAYLVHSDSIAFGFGAAPALEDQKAIEYGTGSRKWVMDALRGQKLMQEGKLAVRIRKS